MYLKSNKGSILIFTLIIFSIISVTTMMCIGLSYSNRCLFNLEYRDIIIKENALSGLEIANSNILKEVEKVVSNSTSKEEFNEYFQGNDFIYNIKNISKTELNNVSIDIPNKPIYDERGFLIFNIVSTYKDNRYNKQLLVKVKIDNPFFCIDSNDEIQVVDEIPTQIDTEENLKNINTNIDYKKLVKVYGYKEI